MTTVRVGAMVADVEGDGAAVVMLHGLGGTSNTFQPQMAALSSFRTVRFDLPGAGRSPVPHEPLSVGGLAAAVIAALPNLGVGRAHFVGHSMGTLICQHIAAMAPGLVASLVLFGAILEPAPAAREGLAARARLARHEGMAPIADQIIQGSIATAIREENPAVAAFVRESVMRQDAEGYARHCEALAAAEAADHRLITAPALLVTGEEDAVAPVGMARDLADRLPSARLRTLDRCGHWSTLERPRACNERMGDFLLRVS
ncbi:alpha/beta fold hydrolase [Acidisphaera rubrifaciens]|uniref:Hydrolase alpha/beta n=1 Tax=Acidisphaera rubrifaciens HS-AP3 TaxID=1231350 RepID=A0A0D6P640_9PROT|nr:alpha/beta hydrolase [Acidisphaera rubrifaciens]GAN76811.1 hydrolase alpha/beta [Acidisphaera rubrifaciens HS-AP3]